MRKCICAIAVLLVVCTSILAAPIGGVLKNAAGEPVAGVKVYSFLIECTSNAAPKVEASVVTDTDGKYSLGDLPKLTDTQWRYVVAYLPGKYLNWTLDNPDMPKMEQYMGKQHELMAIPVTPKTGRVVDKSGHALAGAKVKYWGIRNRSTHAMLLSCEVLKLLGIKTSFTSGRDGTFTVADVPSDEVTILSAEKDGLAMRDAAWDVSQKIVMVPAGKIKGKVVDANGKAVSGVTVQAERNNRWWSAGETDSTGGFTVAAVAPGKWSIYAHSNGSAFPRVSGAVVTAGKTTQIKTIVGKPMAAVEGQVLCKDTGAPVGDVDVTVNTAAMYVVNDGRSKTDANGRFKAIVPVGKGYLFTSDLPVGYVNTRYDCSIVVPKNGVHNLKIMLAKAEVAKGRVVDENGKPVSDANVSLLFGDENVATTDADGRFQLPLPLLRQTGPDADDLSFCVYNKQHSLGIIQSVKRSDLKHDDLKLVVRPVVSVKLHVTLPNGKPAVGAKVTRSTTSDSVTGSTDFDSANAAKTDGSGNTTMNCLLAGATYQVRAALRGYADSGKRPVIVPGTAVPRTIDIRLERADRVQKGTVIDENGKLVAGAYVYWDKDEMGSVSTYTNSSGRFTLGGLPDRWISLNASKGNSYGTVAVGKTSGAVRIRLIRENY